MGERVNTHTSKENDTVLHTSVFTLPYKVWDKNT